MSTEVDIAVPSRAGTQFGDVFNIFGRGAATGPTEGPSLSQKIQSYFGYQPNPVGNAVQNAADSFINLFKFGNVSSATDTGVSTPRISSSFNPNIAIGSAAAVATGLTIYATTTNPGVQTTTQAVANAIKPISSATNSVLSTNYGPYIVIGGLLLIGALILKK